MSNPNRPSSSRPSSPPPAGGRSTSPKPVATTREQRTFLERLGALNNRGTLLIGTGVVLIAVLGLIAFGVWDSYIGASRRTAVEVGNREYDVTYFSRRLAAEVNDPVLATTLTATQLAVLPEQLANDIIEEEVALQRAGTINIGITSNELDQALAAKLPAVLTTDENGNPVRSAGFEIALRNYLQRSGLTLAQLRRAVHGQRLRTEAHDYWKTQVPATTQAVRYRLINVADEAKAKDLKARADAGEDFAILATANSLDTTTQPNGGLKDFSPVVLLPQEVQDAVKVTGVGKVSEPFKTGTLWTIIKVEALEENRPVTENEREDLGEKLYTDWLEAGKMELGARSYMEDQDLQRWVFERSGALERLAAAQTNPNPIIPQPQITVPPAVVTTVPTTPNIPPPAATAAPGGTP